MTPKMGRAGACVAALVGALCLAPPGAAAVDGRIGITVSPHVKTDTAYNISIQGFARRAAIAYLFLDYAGCAKSIAVERQHPGTAHRRYPVNGAFTKVSGWSSSGTGVDHACAYLVGRQSGSMIAIKRVVFRIR